MALRFVAIDIAPYVTCRCLLAITLPLSHPLVPSRLHQREKAPNFVHARTLPTTHSARGAKAHNGACAARFATRKIRGRLCWGWRTPMARAATNVSDY